MSEAKITNEDDGTVDIDYGLVIYVGVAKGDTEVDCVYLARKVRSLKLWPDRNNEVMWAHNIWEMQYKIIVAYSPHLYKNSKGSKLVLKDIIPRDEAEKMY